MSLGYNLTLPLIQLDANKTGHPSNSNHRHPAVIQLVTANTGEAKGRVHVAGHATLAAERCFDIRARMLTYAEGARPQAEMQAHSDGRT